MVQSKLGDRWEHIYRVVLLPRFDAEYEICNWFTGTYPQSPDVNNLTAARPGPHRTRLTPFNARFRGAMLQVASSAELFWKRTSFAGCSRTTSP